MRFLNEMRWKDILKDLLYLYLILIVGAVLFNIAVALVEFSFYGNLESEQYHWQGFYEKAGGVAGFILIFAGFLRSAYKAGENKRVHVFIVALIVWLAGMSFLDGFKAGLYGFCQCLWRGRRSTFVGGVLCAQAQNGKVT